jgi:hypothetical protein
LKNRQSAALSRQRKKEYITDLEERTNGLITENHDLVQKIAKLSSLNVEFKIHIDSLEKCLSETKNENVELRSRLASITTQQTSTSSSTTSTTTTSTTAPTPATSEEDTHMASPPTSSPAIVQTQPASNS